jgi:hypothetical protein
VGSTVHDVPSQYSASVNDPPVVGDELEGSAVAPNAAVAALQLDAPGRYMAPDPVWAPPSGEEEGTSASRPGRGRAPSACESALAVACIADAAVAPGVPSAMHDAGVAQETAPRNAPGSAGVLSTLQVEPFHDSVSGPDEGGDATPPTAVQAESDGHETPDSSTSVAPSGVGTVCWDHAVPFQLSASGTSASASSTKPTAMHTSADEHDSDVKLAPRAPDGAGTVSSAHAVPLNDSASNCSPVSFSK